MALAEAPEEDADEKTAQDMAGKNAEGEAMRRASTVDFFHDDDADFLATHLCQESSLFGFDLDNNLLRNGHFFGLRATNVA